MAGLFIKGSICLEDIPEDEIFHAKNGKRYVNFTIAERRDLGKYGETHALYISRAKPHIGGENIEYEKVYIDNGKPYDKKD